MDVPAVANTIVPSPPQLAPRGGALSLHTETGGPPAIETFFNSVAP